jgi:hypothetical protein
MRQYLISANKQHEPLRSGEWLNAIIEAIGNHRSASPAPKIAWRVLHSHGEMKGEGAFQEHEVDLIHVDFEISFSEISREIVERWFLLQPINRPGSWHLQLDEILNGYVLVKAGRDYVSVRDSLRTTFDSVHMYPEYINKIVGSELIKI